MTAPNVPAVGSRWKSRSAPARIAEVLSTWTGEAGLRSDVPFVKIVERYVGKPGRPPKRSCSLARFLIAFEPVTDEAVQRG